MKGKFYNAFVEAGFAREANTLSETRKIKGRTRVVPAIGHYIAVLDNLGISTHILDIPYGQRHSKTRNDYRRQALGCDAFAKVEDYLVVLKYSPDSKRDGEKLKKVKDLAEKLGIELQTNTNSEPKIPAVEVK